MKVTNTSRRLVRVEDPKGEIYHVPPRAREVDLPTITEESDLPKELVKVSD